MKNIIYIFLVVLFMGCIEEYVPKGIHEENNLLIVDGIISEGESVIKLTRSVGLNGNVSNIKLVMNAQLHVESTDGTIYPFKLNSSYGDYSANIEEFKPGEKYRLIIKLEGLEYQSDYLEPMKTPAVDTVYVQKDNDIDASVRVSAHGTADNSKYYRWTYNEIWEIQSRIKVLAIFVNGVPTMVYEEDGIRDEGRYCWVYNRYMGYSVATSEDLTENRIVGKKLLETSIEDERFSQLYYIDVKQNSIRKATYDYITNIEKNIEEIGSIFGPMPSEMKGNITCVTNPDNPVIGYIDVSTTTRKSLFLPYPNDIYEEGLMIICKLEEVTHISGSYGMVSFRKDPDGIFYTVAPLKCMDCRYNGGTKVKPPFWPNDHI